jgi:hypothetical protein|tara:strand:- start:257 stop:583 length:327 start_codon:yes stop_codon:yes gene_type:complete
VVTYGFEWAKEAISDDLSTCGGDSESNSLVLGNVVTGGRSVDILEDLIESELTETLSGVSEEGWSPSEGESLEAFSSLDLSETITNSGVESWGSLNKKTRSKSLSMMS